jgi:hypothetical protein
VVATCAFCLADVDPEAPGGLSMGIGSERVETRQGFYVHAACLAEKLHPDTQFDPETFEPVDDDDAPYLPLQRALQARGRGSRGEK